MSFLNDTLGLGVDEELLEKCFQQCITLLERCSGEKQSVFAIIVFRKMARDILFDLQFVPRDERTDFFIQRMFESADEVIGIYSYAIEYEVDGVNSYIRVKGE